MSYALDSFVYCNLSPFFISSGHYNEYKVLQAMRAKLAAEEDSDEDDEPNK